MAALRPAWLPRWLFRLTALAAAVLIVLVLLSPLLDNDGVPQEDWRRVVALFARDAMLRRTAVASALGLLVTACIFFRRPAASRPAEHKRKQPGRSPPPAGAAGA